MHIVRVIVWVLLLAVLLIFSINNWNPVEVKIWEGLVLETKVPALVVLAFLLGLTPMWLLHRTTKWQLNRRINSLESAARTAAIAHVSHAAPVTQVDGQPVSTEPGRVRPSPTDEPGLR